MNWPAVGCICCKEEFKAKFKCLKAGSEIKLAYSYLVDADRPDAFRVENSELYSTATPEEDDLITKLEKKISILQAKE